MKRKFWALYAGCVLAFYGTVGQAADTSSSAAVTAGLSYSDNVCLSANDVQGEWIALVTPEVQTDMSGRNAHLDLVAALEINSLSDSDLEDIGCRSGIVGNREQFTPRLNANADAVLLEDWMFINATAQVSQNRVSPFLAGGNDSLNRTGNTNTFYLFRVTPYVAHRFGDSAHVSLRYSWDEIQNSSDLLRDSEQGVVSFDIGNAGLGSPLIWGAEVSYDKVEYSESLRQAGTTSELSSARVKLGYQFNRSYQLNGFVGQEENDFVTSYDDTDGDFWDIGFLWTPNLRTEVEVGTGDRFFGSTPRFFVSYWHKHSKFSAGYERRLTYDRNIRTVDDSLTGGGEGLDPVNPAANDSTTSTSPILDDRFSLGYRYEGQRSNFQVDASYSDQTRAEDERDSTFKRVSFSLDRYLSRLIQLEGSLSWDERLPGEDRGDLVVDSDTFRFAVALRRMLAEDSEISLDYQFTDRSSENASSEYRENRIMVSLRFGL